PPPVKSSSTPPAEFGAPKAFTTMLSNACASRGSRSKELWAADVGQLPRKQRYVAVTCNVAEYEVFMTRTSEKKGLTPTIEATAGMVTRSDWANAAAAKPSRAAAEARRLTG